MPSISTTNLTGLYDFRQNALLWEDAGLSTTHPGDNEFIVGVEDANNPASGFALIDSIALGPPKLQVGANGGLDASEWLSGGNTLLRGRDHSNTVNKALSNFVSVGAKTVFGIVMVTEDAPNTTATPIYSNIPTIFGANPHTRFGLFQRTYGGQDYLCGWNDFSFGSGNEVQVAVPRNQILVFALRHNSATPILGLSVNQGTEVTTSSVDSGDLTGVLQIGSNGSSGITWGGLITLLAFYDAHHAPGGADYDDTYQALMDFAFGVAGGFPALTLAI